MKNQCPTDSGCRLVHPPNCKWKESCRNETCQFAHPPYCRTTIAPPQISNRPVLDCKWGENCHFQGDQHFADWAHPASHPKARAVSKEIPVKLVYAIENHNFPPLQKLDDKQKKKHYDPPPTQSPKLVPANPTADRIQDERKHNANRNKSNRTEQRGDATRSHPKQNKLNPNSKQTHPTNPKYQPKNRDSQTTKPPKATENVLYVSNLPYSFEDDDLANLFEGLSISSSVVIKNKDGSSKGFGFVEFENEFFMMNALQRDGSVVSQADGETRTIKCSPKLATKPAKPRKIDHHGGYFDPAYQLIAQQWNQAVPGNQGSMPSIPAPLSATYPFPDPNFAYQSGYYAYSNPYSSSFQQPHFTPFVPYGNQTPQPNSFQGQSSYPVGQSGVTYANGY